MVDKLPRKIEELNDVQAMRSMLEQLVELGQTNQSTIAHQTNRIEELTGTVEEQTRVIVQQTETVEEQTRIINQQTKTIKQQTETIKQQSQTIEEKQGEIAELKRMLFGKKSERIPPINRSVNERRKKDPEKKKKDKKAAAKKRKDNAKTKKKLPLEKKKHPVEASDCQCPKCGSSEFKDMGWDISYEYEFVPAHIKRIEHRRQQKICQCGEHIITAPAPSRVSEGVQYGPGFHAYTVVSKCLDSIPFYRLAKQFERFGVPVCRSTLCDMFHRMAELLRPLSDRLLEQIAASDYVNADETRLKVQDKGKTRQAYIWVFIAGKRIGYVYSPSRSGKTPVRILGQSTGILQVDQYSGYNQVTTPDKRTRVGCLAHLRRKFFDAQNKAPKLVQHVLEKILDLYEVEYEAAAQNILGSDRHLAMRKALSAPIMTKLKAYLDEQRPKHLPKGPIGKAISYAVENWEEMTQFLSDPKIRLDNNISEANLRLIALGRKNYLFVGHDLAGENLAVLQTLVATCVANGVNPQEYLADVIIRIQTHPQSKLDDLLPQNWQPPDKKNESRE